MKRLLPVLILLLLPEVSGLRADEAGDARERVLARIGAQAATLKDLTADFEQKSLREGLSKPVLSRGTLRYRIDPKEGAEVLLSITEPEPTFIKVSRSKMETYIPEDKQVEVIDLKDDEAGARAVEATVLLYGRPRAFWEERFEIALTPRDPKASADAPDELVLVPRDEGLRRTLKEIRMGVAPDTGLPVRVKYVYARGEEVTMDFGRVKANTGLKDKDLALDVPRGTEVLRPGGDGEEKP